MRLILPIAVALCAGCGPHTPQQNPRSEEHTSELQSQSNLVCRLLLEKKKQQAIGQVAITPSSSCPGTPLMPYIPAGLSMEVFVTVVLTLAASAWTRRGSLSTSTRSTP